MQLAVAETSDVASFTDSFTFVCVLAKPALPGDITTDEGLPVSCSLAYLWCSVGTLQWCSIVVNDSVFARFCHV